MAISAVPEASASTALTTTEQHELATLETIIEAGLETFLEVGQALLDIRTKRLYRQEHPTFEEYCKRRRDMSSRQANRLIAAVGVVENLGPIGPLPSHESQLRPLTSFSPEQQRELWRSATASANGGPITAAHVKDAAFNRVHFSSKSSEYYAPECILERVVDVLGSIDLDPCSNDAGEPIVRAEKYFTKNDDGLPKQRFGRV